MADNGIIRDRLQLKSGNAVDIEIIKIGTRGEIMTTFDFPATVEDIREFVAYASERYGFESRQWARHDSLQSARRQFEMNAYGGGRN